MRLTQLTDDPSGDSLSQNFLVFIPTNHSGVLTPIITQVMPLPDETVRATNLVIGAVIMNRDTAVNVSSIQLQLNGSPVDAAIEENGVTVTLTSVPMSLSRARRLQVQPMSLTETEMSRAPAIFQRYSPKSLGALNLRGE